MFRKFLTDLFTRTPYGRGLTDAKSVSQFPDWAFVNVPIYDLRGSDTANADDYETEEVKHVAA